MGEYTVLPSHVCAERPRTRIQTEHDAQSAFYSDRELFDGVHQIGVLDDIKLETYSETSMIAPTLISVRTDQPEPREHTTRPTTRTFVKKAMWLAPGSPCNHWQSSALEAGRASPIHDISLSACFW